MVHDFNRVRSHSILMDLALNQFRSGQGGLWFTNLKDYEYAVSKISSDSILNNYKDRVLFIDFKDEDTIRKSHDIFKSVIISKKIVVATIPDDKKLSDLVVKGYLNYIHENINQNFEDSCRPRINTDPYTPIIFDHKVFSETKNVCVNLAHLRAIGAGGFHFHSHIEKSSNTEECCIIEANTLSHLIIEGSYSSNDILNKMINYDVDLAYAMTMGLYDKYFSEKESNLIAFYSNPRAAIEITN